LPTQNNTQIEGKSLKITADLSCLEKRSLPQGTIKNHSLSKIQGMPSPVGTSKFSRDQFLLQAQINPPPPSLTDGWEFDLGVQVANDNKYPSDVCR